MNLEQSSYLSDLIPLCRLGMLGTLYSTAPLHTTSSRCEGEMQTWHNNGKKVRKIKNELQEVRA